MYISDFVYSSLNTRMNSEHILAIVNKVAINMGVQIPLCDPTFIYFGSMPRVKLPDPMVIIFFLIFIFKVYFIDYAIIVVSFFLPSLPLHLAPHLPPAFCTFS